MNFWVFILCIQFLLRAGHCLGVSFLFFSLAHVLFLSFICGLAGAPATPPHCSCCDVIHPFFVLSLLLGLQAEMPTIPISHIISSFSLYCPAFLLGQSIQHLELPRPISFFGHPRPISFFGHPWLISFFPTFFIPIGFC